VKKLLIATLIGIIIGASTGLVILHLGLAANPLTLAAWTFVGALIGFGHGAAHLLLETFVRWANEERLRRD
jgi:hypothetical protein